MIVFEGDLPRIMSGSNESSLIRDWLRPGVVGCRTLGPEYARGSGDELPESEMLRDRRGAIVMLRPARVGSQGVVFMSNETWYQELCAGAKNS